MNGVEGVQVGLIGGGEGRVESAARSEQGIASTLGGGDELEDGRAGRLDFVRDV